MTYEKAVTTFDGYGVHLGTTFDAMGGKVLAGIGYMDGDMHHADDGKLGNVNAYTASLCYEYALSMRTKVYSGMGWQKRELQGHYGTTPVNAKFEAYDVVAGLVHTF